MRDNIRKLNKIINDHKLTIFCGSGISFSSKVPGVNAIINALVDPLIKLTPTLSHDWEKLIRDIDKNGYSRIIIQFEVIMGYFRQEIGDDIFSEFLKRIFDTNINRYTPNNLHKSIALLAQKGKVKDIYTTNFDTLIEQSLQDCNVVFNSTTENDFINNDIVNVIKIHGCISRPNTILTTMRDVSSNANKCIEILKTCFAGDGVVLFLGYSCSDFADIQPAVKMAGKINATKKKIVVINHCTSESRIIDFSDLNNLTNSIFQLPDIEKIKSYFIDVNPKNNFEGLIIRDDTEILPICLNIYNNENPKKELESFSYTDYISNYYKKQKEYKIYWIIGNICEKLGEYNEAIKYIRHSLLLAKEKNELLKDIVKLNMDLAVAFYRKSDYRDAIITINECIKDAIHCFGYNSEEVAQLYDNLGLNYACVDESSVAITKHHIALDIARFLPNNNKSLIGNIYNNLGNAYFNVKDYENSLLYYKHALDIFQKLYSKQDSSVATVMNNIGGVYLELNDFDNAHKYYMYAYDIWRHTLSSNHPNIAIVIANIGDVFFKQNDFKNAYLKQISALRIRLRILDYPHSDLFESYERLGNCYYKLRQIPIALKCYTKAKEICRDNKDIPLLFKRQITRKQNLLIKLNALNIDT